MLTNFQSLDDHDLLLFPEPVMEKLLASDHLAISSEKMALERLLYWMKHEARLFSCPLLQHFRVGGILWC